MTNQQASTQADNDVTKLEEQMDQSKELQRTIGEAMKKLSPEQYQELQERLLAKMSPEQKERFEQLQQQIQQQGAPKASPVELAAQSALDAFKSVADAAKSEPNMTFDQKIALANAAAEFAKGIAALETAQLGSDQLAIALQQGRGAKASSNKIPFGFGLPNRKV